eukprot:5295079-Amphidinium_carterae.1
MLFEEAEQPDEGPDLKEDAKSDKCDEDQNLEQETEESVEGAQEDEKLQLPQERKNTPAELPTNGMGNVFKFWALMSTENQREEIYM